MYPTYEVISKLEGHLLEHDIKELEEMMELVSNSESMSLSKKEATLTTLLNLYVTSLENKAMLLEELKAVRTEEAQKFKDIQVKRNQAKQTRDKRRGRMIFCAWLFVVVFGIIVYMDWLPIKPLSDLTIHVYLATGLGVFYIAEVGNNLEELREEVDYLKHQFNITGE